MKKIIGTFLTGLWYLGSILQVITLPLCMAALKDVSITYDWFKLLKKYEHIEITYYVTAAITMFIFAILVLISRYQKKMPDMLIALMGFAVQGILLASAIIAQFN